MNKRIDAIVAKGEPECPNEVRFTTYTLRYNRVRWVDVDGLEKHWERGPRRAATSATTSTVDDQDRERHRP